MSGTGNRKFGETAGRLYKYIAEIDEKKQYKNSRLAEKLSKDEPKQAKPEMAEQKDGDMPGPEAAGGIKENPMLEKLKEAVVWSEILSEPLSKRKRRR